MSRGLLLLLRRVSRVQLCATPQTAAPQAPLSLGFSRQEHWSGCHFLLQCMRVKSESEVAQSCPTLSGPMECSLAGSSFHGIFQARVLEWGAIAFSGVEDRTLQKHLLPANFFSLYQQEAVVNFSLQYFQHSEPDPVHTVRNISLSGVWFSAPQGTFSNLRDISSKGAASLSNGTKFQFSGCPPQNI